MASYTTTTTNGQHHAICLVCGDSATWTVYESDRQLSKHTVATGPSHLMGGYVDGVSSEGLAAGFERSGDPSIFYYWGHVSSGAKFLLHGQDGRHVWRNKHQLAVFVTDWVYESCKAAYRDDVTLPPELKPGT